MESITLNTGGRIWLLSQYVYSKHPPDEEYRDDSPCDVNYPIASCFRFPKVEHAAMVAGGAGD